MACQESETELTWLCIYLRDDDEVAAAFQFQANNKITPQTEYINYYTLDYEEDIDKIYVLPTSSLPSKFEHRSTEWHFSSIKPFTIRYASNNRMFRVFYKLKFSFFKYQGF